ncbi:hypothetical protein [Rothia sp. HMSC072E10]|uniref:hypothetical protein n=1 Tax=Rothia sp. HMSC072E10 TaxID=1739448 RepID=UPI0008A11457|nr:hypothetical protein [Rothia sp. HMSC072E10]OFQ33815.1 hypothetical protein HMPREF2944_02975 [Rothia sp. HMSC072E10]
MQQPYLSSPSDSGGVPSSKVARQKTPHRAAHPHAGVRIPRRSASAATSASAVTPSEALVEERTFRVPHPVLSLLSWLIAVASVAWLAVLGVNLTHLVLSGLEHDSDFLVLTYGVYMACAFGFLCFGAFFGLHFGLGSSAHWRSSIRHPNRPY